MKKIILFLVIAFAAIIAAEGVLAFSGVGAGTTANPYNITNCSQLQEMQNALSSVYQLVNNIDCSMTTGWNSGAGFAPIATFTGNFSGNNFNITSLNINRTTNNLGLFGIASGGSVLKEVNLLDVNITGVGAVTGVAGLVATHNGGTISNVFVSGRVSSTQGGTVGCLAGTSYANTSNSGTNCTSYSRDGSAGLVAFQKAGTVEDCYATGYVQTWYGFAAGLIYQADSGVTIDNCYTNNTNLTSYNTAAGLVSLNYGKIYNSYTAGIFSITDPTYSGAVGLVDTNYGTIKYCYSTSKIGYMPNSGAGFVYTNNGNISNCYATGNVSVRSSSGGFVGVNTGIINNSYSTGYILNGNTGIYNGGFVGDNQGIIENSYSTGGLIYSQRTNSGGFAGRQTGANSRIVNCYSTGNLNINYCSSNAEGGFIGVLSSGTIKNSYSSGNVYCGPNEPYSYLGGFVGNNVGGIINNSFCKGNATGFAYNKEGFAGLLGSSAILSNVYWLNTTANPNNCWGNGTYPTFYHFDTYCTAQTNSAYFFNSSNAPMSPYWDFTNIWLERTNNDPILKSFLGEVCTSDSQCADGNCELDWDTGIKYCTTANQCIDGVGANLYNGNYTLCNATTWYKNCSSTGGSWLSQINNPYPTYSYCTAQNDAYGGWRAPTTVCISNQTNGGFVVNACNSCPTGYRASASMNGCFSSCTSDIQCVTDYFCSGGSCVYTLSNSTTYTELSSYDCQSEINFLANYTNITSGTMIQGAICNITFAAYAYTFNMTWNTINYNYTSPPALFANGMLSWTTTCYNSSFNTRTASGSVMITGENCAEQPVTIPEFSTVGIILTIIVVGLATALIMKHKGKR